jgi:ribosomal protein L37AE/L43A
MTQEYPVKPYTEVCPQCGGEIEILYSWGVWSCSKCRIKIHQKRGQGIIKIEPLASFRIDPLERKIDVQ